MIVTEIRPKNKSKSIIVLDEEIAFVLYKGDFAKYHILSGEELRREDYDEIMNEILPKRALDRSYKLLMSKDYTVKQLWGKLKNDGYPDSVIDETIMKLKQFKYLDDKRYAENYLFWKAKDRSRSRMLMDLKQKGIDSDVATKLYDELLNKGDIDLEDASIRRFLQKKNISLTDIGYEEKQKIIQTLLRKGYNYENIIKCFTDFS